MLELKRGDRPRVQTEMVEFIAFRSPPQKNLVISRRSCAAGRQRNVQKSVMHVESCFAN